MAVVVFGATLVSCSDGNYDDTLSVEGETPVRSADADVEGFVKIFASGNRIVLGTNSESSLVKERPQMEVSFTYDFAIGDHEVTCDEFNRVAEKSGMLLKLDCSMPKLPASDVTFYDAVLFANAMSVMLSRDTAYSYRAAVFDGSNHCVNLDGFSFNSETDGMRLPTEAEWMFVAKQGWNPAISWNALNSGYKKHPVCTQPPNRVRVCDMAGNVMEWVNDWMGYFKDTSVTNFVGAPDGGGIGERIVKGGSFRNDTSALKLYRRGDVYTVTSLTHADYVGFRLAYGKIPDALWMDLSGQASTSPVKLLIGNRSMRSLAGTSTTKLVFRNEVTGKLAYVDFLSPYLAVKDLPDTLDAYHPDISPDGHWVAFCTGLEGVSGKSSVYVRRLDASDLNVVRLDVESAAIPRWQVLPDGDTVIVYVTDAGNNSDEAVFKKASTWQVRFSAGKFGTPQKLFDGSFHGGVSADRNLAVTGARLLRARVAGGTDTLWYDGDQACNASLSNDGSKRTAFLDFGGDGGRKFVGTAYGVHERILVADSTGALIHSVAAPAGFSFDHVEWALNSKSGNLLVATLMNPDGNHSKIVLVNLDDDSVTDIAESDDLWHPCFWSNNYSTSPDGNALDLDSAGIYFIGEGSEVEVFYRYKLELLWNYYEQAVVVALGSSRMLNGFNPSLLDPSHFAINLSTVPNTMYTSMFLFENYVLPHVEGLRYLLISLDLDLWYKNDTDDNFFYRQYQLFPGFVYDENHGFWKDGVPEGLTDAVNDAPGSDYYKTVLTGERGFFSDETGDWGTGDLVNYDSTWLDQGKTEFENAFAHLADIIRMAKEKNVKVVGIIFPQSPAYANTGSFGRYGIRRSQVGKIMDRLDSLGRVYSNFILFDENKMGKHDYPSSMATNQDHLNRSGAEQMTARLDSLMRALE